MAKNIEKIYNDIFKLRAAMEDVVEKSQGIVTSSREFPGMISNVLTEQFNKYFIPTMRAYIDDIKTPGSIPGIVKFLDAVPLAFTREKEPISPVEPVIPENVNVTAPAGSVVKNPVEEIPHNASFAKPQGETTNESHHRADRMSEFKAHLDYEKMFHDLLEETDNLTTGPFGEDDTSYDANGFNLYAQNGETSVSFDPETKRYRIYLNYEDGDGEVYEDSAEGEGWNNMIRAIWDDLCVSSFYGAADKEQFLIPEGLEEAKKEKDKNEEPKKYQVVRKSNKESTLGEISNLEDKVVYEHSTKEEAEAKVEELNKTITADEKELFGTEYVVEEK